MVLIRSPRSFVPLIALSKQSRELTLGGYYESSGQFLKAHLEALVSGPANGVALLIAQGGKQVLYLSRSLGRDPISPPKGGRPVTKVFAIIVPELCFNL
jgi:hypothetical protein